MPIKTPQAAPIQGFGLGTKKATETHPVKVINVDSDAKFGTVAYEEAVRLACLAAKAEDQRRLEVEQNVSRQQSE